MSRGTKPALARALREARIARGLTQVDLARRAGLAPNHVARLESGEKSDPRFATVANLARALGLSLDDLAGIRPSREAKKKAGVRIAEISAALRKIRRAVLALDEI